MPLIGSVLKNRRAGETHLAWNLPNLAGPETITLTSQAFGEGAAIPLRYAGKRAGGENMSPELAWSPVPEGCAQLLLVVEDIDAPLSKPFVHCVALIEPASTEAEQGPEQGPGGLAAGVLRAGEPAAGVRTLRSGMGRGYHGPEPIKGHGAHHYVFQLFALSAAVTANGSSLDQAKPREILAAVPGPVLARGRLTGTYQR